MCDHRLPCILIQNHNNFSLKSRINLVNTPCFPSSTQTTSSLVVTFTVSTSMISMNKVATSVSILIITLCISMIMKRKSYRLIRSWREANFLFHMYNIMPLWRRNFGKLFILIAALENRIYVPRIARRQHLTECFKARVNALTTIFYT